MKKIIFTISMIFLVSFLVTPAHSGLKKVGQTGFQFLKVDASPRAAGMGGAYMMVGYDASAMFYNPAGLGNMEKSFDFFAGQTQWIADVKYNYAGLAKSFDMYGTVGISFMNADYGSDIVGTRVAANEQGYIETGKVDIGSYVVGVAYSKKLSNKFTVGGQIRYASQHLGSNLMPDGSTQKNEVGGLVYDFGTIFYPGWKSFRFGVSVRNFSKEFKYEQESFELPLTFTIGFAMNLMDFWQTPDHSLIMAIDAIHPRDYSERLNLGFEYWFKNMFALRTGYRYNYDEEGFTAGLGFHYNISGIDLKVDYSYSSFGVFDAVNRFGIGFSF